MKAENIAIWFGGQSLTARGRNNATTTRSTGLSNQY
jgi:hypothetical protein